MNTLRNEKAQSAIMAIVFLTVLVGMSAAVLDVGSWFRADRQLQATADAAALAGAQALPYDPAQAGALGAEYAAKNGGPAPWRLEFSKHNELNDTITVAIKRPAPGFFTKIFGLNSVEVGAKASARASSMSKAKWAAPIGVDKSHPYISNIGCPCFGEPYTTVLELNKVGPGGFKLLNLDDTKGGTSPAILAQWMREGLDRYMDLDWYYSDPGSKFNSGNMRDALDARVGTELLFPIYDQVQGEGSNLEYHVVGWIGFHLTGYDISGKGKLFGWFTKVVWEGIQSEAAGQPSFGARAIALVD